MFFLIISHIICGLQIIISKSLNKLYEVFNIFPEIIYRCFPFIIHSKKEITKSQTKSSFRKRFCKPSCSKNRLIVSVHQSTI